MPSTVVVSHVSGEPTPAHHLVRVLNRWGWDTRLVTLPFHFSPVPGAEATDHPAGRPGRPRALAARPASIWAQLLRDPLTILGVFRDGRRFDLYVGLDNLNAFCGILLRRLGRVDRVAYYVIDHTEQRFANPVLNWLYARLDAFCCRHADQVWVLSPPMAKAKAARGAGTRLVMTPIGVELAQVGRVAARARPRGRIVILSHLAASKGVQLAIAAMPKILKALPSASLSIIGDGPYAGELKRQARALNLGSKVRFLGLVPSHQRVLQLLKTADIGLAPYLEDPANYTHYADPAKPKEYLACGLPVVITRVPWIAAEIERRPMGVAITYDQAGLEAACLRLLRNPALWARCRAQGLRFAKGLDWEGIFRNSLARAGMDVPAGARVRGRA